MVPRPLRCFGYCTAALVAIVAVVPVLIYKLEGGAKYPGHGVNWPTSLQGKVVVVTGSSQGLGFFAATEAYNLGATVLITGRSMTKCQKAATQIELQGVNGRNKGTAIPMNVDISNFDDVRRFAAWVGSKFEKIDVLLLNAGMGYGPDWPANTTSHSGHDLCMATNHLGHYLLARLLWPRLATGAGVVGVGGGGMWRSAYATLTEKRIRWELPKNKPRRTQAYFQAKLSQRCFALAARRRLEERGINVNFYLPGLAATAILGPSFDKCQEAWYKWCGPASVAGRLLLETAFVPSNQPTDNVHYAYWWPKFIYERVMAKQDLKWRMDHPMFLAFPSFYQYFLNYGVLHQTVGPECDVETQERVWKFSAQATGLPP